MSVVGEARRGDDESEADASRASHHAFGVLFVCGQGTPCITLPLPLSHLALFL